MYRRSRPVGSLVWRAAFSCVFAWLVVVTSGCGGEVSSATRVSGASGGADAGDASGPGGGGSVGDGGESGGRSDAGREARRDGAGNERADGGREEGSREPDASVDDEAPPAVAVAAGGEAALEIVVSPGASEAVRGHAETLRRQLGRITGGSFSIVEGEGTRGIAVGVAGDISAPGVPDLAPETPFDREDYLVRTHENGIYLVGATELAVRHAVWDLLRRAGYRQYFPGETWEIVPDRPDLEIAVDEVESPAFVWRRIFWGGGTWDANKDRLADWKRKNAARGAFQINNGHVWKSIIRANEETFAQHPEYRGEDETGEPTDKLCVTRPAVQQMAIDWAIAWLERRPEQDAVPMEPSDGLGWEGCPQDDEQLGTASNRAIFLANKVAEGVNQHFDEPKYVGMYAYSEHQRAPTIAIHERVVPSVATAFLEPGVTADDLFRAWNDAGAKQMGMRGYYNVVGWSYALPGGQQASSPSHVEESLRDSWAQGARFFTIESSDAWGPTGLGHWMAMRLAWEIDDRPGASLREKLRDDFLTRAFGEAREPMERLYGLLDREHELMISDHLVGRVFRTLERGLERAESPEVRARIHDLIKYARYVHLFRDYEHAESGERQARLEELLRYAYRIRDTHMVHSYARYRYAANLHEEASVPAGAGFDVPEADNPWKRDEPVSEAEIREFLDAGIAEHPLRGFEPRAYSRDLVSAAPLGLDATRWASIGARSERRGGLEGRELQQEVDEFYRAETDGRTGAVSMYTRVPEGAPEPFDLEVSVSAENVDGSKGGRPIPVELYALDGGVGSDSEPVGTTEVPVDHEVHRTTFEAPAAGLYRLEISARGRFVDVRLHDEQRSLRQTYEMSPQRWVQGVGRSSYLFYVPEGVETIGGYATPGAETGDAIQRPDGTVAFAFRELDKPGYFSVEVGEGEDGKLWRMDRVHGPERYLLTVPPQVAESAGELLLPGEVVEKDR